MAHVYPNLSEGRGAPDWISRPGSTRRANMYPSSSSPVQQSGGHLGSSRVMNAHEQNLWHVRLGGRSGRHHLFVTDLAPQERLSRSTLFRVWWP